MLLNELFLTEASKYDDMLNPILAYVKATDFRAEEGQPYIDNFDLTQCIKGEFDAAIKWAREVLKRQDAITWYLRLKRLELFGEYADPLHTKSPEMRAMLLRLEQDAGVPPSVTWNDLEPNLGHYMGLPVPAIHNFRFDKQTPDDVFRHFRTIEREWQDSRNQMVDHNDQNTLLLDFGDGWAWMNLNKRNCDDEANAMGHCGNRFGSYSDHLLSLRKKQADGMWRPSLTFVLDENGFLGEMKGRANEKPADRYHDMIIALLKSSFVKGIKGGGHDPANNFEVTDLTTEQQDDLYESKPQLMPLEVYFERHGADEHFRQQAMVKVSNSYGGYATVDWSKAGDEWRLVFEEKGDWMDIIKDFGSPQVEHLINYYHDGGFDQHSYKGYIRDTVTNFPEAYQQKIIAYVKEHHADELLEYTGDEELDEVADREIWNFIEEEHEPDDVVDAISAAYYSGSESAEASNIYESLQSLMQEFEYFDIGETPDGAKWQLYLTPQALVRLIRNDPERLEEGEIEEPLTISRGDDYSGFDEESALERFRDEAPDEALPEIPKSLPDADTMSEDEMRAEYEQLTGRDIGKYAHDEKMMRTTLRRARGSHWGFEEKSPKQNP